MASPKRKAAFRSGYTLLEVLLAMAIGIVLMGALYGALTVQIRHAEVGRQVVEQSTLARAVLARMSRDILGSLGSAAVSPAYQSSNPSSGGSSGTSTASGTTSSSSTTSPGTSASTSGGTSAGSAPGSSSTGAVLINLGVQGTDSQLVLSVSRLPREYDLAGNATTANSNVTGTSLPGISDLRRVCYWLAGDTSAPLGLARYEYKPVTSDDAQSTLIPDVPDESSCVIAEEVKSLTFSYFDGSNWQTSWDGTTPGPDGVTPIGPPEAIAIVLAIAREGSDQPKIYRHVVAIPTSNNLPMLSANANQSTSGSTGSSSPSTGTSSSSTGP